MPVNPSPADPLGYDVLIDEHDLDAGGRSATGEELVLAAIAHRLTCAQLAMVDAPDDQVDYGVDVRRWVGEALTQSELAARVPLIDEVLHRDPRIAATRLTLTRGPASADASLILDVTATLVTGQTISRVASISAVSVEFLAARTGGA